MAVGITDDDSRFDDGDWDQDLVNNETIDGEFGRAGTRFTPEFSYEIRNQANGELTTIYAVEFNGNHVVGFVSDRPLEIGATYEFVRRVSTHPEDLSYSEIADSYRVFSSDGSIPGGGAANGTNPLDFDTDDGGVGDGEEVANGTNPVDNPQDDSISLITLPSEGGVVTAAVWDASTVITQGVFWNKDPFKDSVVGLDTYKIQGATLELTAPPVPVGIADGDGRFDDGDWHQDLVNNETIDGEFGRAGSRITPEFSYEIRNQDTGDLTTIYAVEFNGNEVVGFVSDDPLQVGVTYEFVRRVSTHPEDLNYSEIATAYIG